MKSKHEIKKITVDPKTRAPTLTIEFTLASYKDIENFQAAVVDFENGLTGQKKLTK